MLGIQHRGRRTDLLVTITVTVVIAGLTDMALRALSWNQPRGEVWPSFAPRGGAIGLIWVVLFACMGAARSLVAGAGRRDSARDATMITVLIAACLAYPFYTHFIPGHLTELVGNIASFALTVVIVLRLHAKARMAAALIGLVAIWIVFATVLVMALVSLNGWQTA